MRRSLLAHLSLLLFASVGFAQGSVWSPIDPGANDAAARGIWRVGIDEPAPPAAAPPPAATEPPPPPAPPPPPPPPAVAAPAPKNYVALDLGGVAVFAFNKAVLAGDSKKRIGQLAKVLLKQAGVWKSIEVAGHSDAVGKAAANVEVSLRRASAVRDALVAGGIPAARITAKGYGSTQPIAGVGPKDASQRRVELRFLGVAEESKADLETELRATGP